MRQLALTRTREGCGDHRLCGQVRMECRGRCASDEAAREEGKRGAAAADETTERLTGDVSSVDEASQTTVWRTVTGEAMAKRENAGRRFRRSHRTAAEKIRADGLWGMSSPMRPRGGRGAEAKTTAANEVTGLPQGASLLWTRPRPQKGGERGPAVVIRRDGCGRVAADEVPGTRRPRRSSGSVDAALGRL